MGLLIPTTASSPHPFVSFLPHVNHLCPEDLLRGKLHAPLTARHLHLWEGRCHQLILNIYIYISPSISCDSFFFKVLYAISCSELGVITWYVRDSSLCVWCSSLSRDWKTFSVKEFSISSFEGNVIAVATWLCCWGSNNMQYWSKCAHPCSNKTLFRKESSSGPK